MIQLFSKKRLQLNLILLFLVQVTFAGHELTSGRLNSPAFVKGSSLYVMDNKYFQITGGTPNFRDASSKTRVTIGIDKANTDVLSAYNYRFVIQLNYSTYSGSVLTPATTTRTLDVSYDPVQGGLNYKDLAVLEIDGGYLVNAKIVDIINLSTSASVTTPPSHLYFETEVDADRYYNMDFFTQPLYTLSSPLLAVAIPASDEIEIKWPYITGAEEYDLEWVWVSDDIMTPFNYVIDFKNNSTRVRTSNQHYRISNVFEKGKVFFRVRGVGYTDLTSNGIFDQIYFTSWTMDDYTSTTPGTYACPSSPSNIFCVTIDHEEDKNWQYKATYAEEGKKKEVVSYFDGTLRNRQSVTKSNSDENAIVAETYYDYQGRAAVQALPVPVSNSNIKFYQYNVALSGVTNNIGFNFVQGTKEVFDREHFDKDATGGNCDAIGSGLENDPLPGSKVGTAHYYSSDNINKTFQQGYVPDANHFPYTQTEYTPDNTGRIARQGGVGPLHQLSSGHETKYFYGSPTLQEELDRMFGSNVGDYKHYKKNMVIDANGQVSLSYLDQEGRTVATALAGKSPANTYSLASNTGSTSLSGNLLNKDASTDVDDDQDNNILESGGKELIFSKEMLVATQGNYNFTYDMTGTAFTYSCEAQSRCYDCIYDLEINIFDKCGQNPPGFTPVKHKVGNILPEQINGAGGVDVNFVCDGPIQFNLTPSPLVVDLAPGAYTVYKKLSIDEDAMSAYLKEYIDNNSCIRTEQSFIDSAKAHIDTSGCNLTCDACVLSLGSEAEFIANGGTATLYAQAVRDCREPCEYKTSCEAAYIALLADMSPGGQYADFENGNNCDPGAFPLSVLNDNNMLPKWGGTVPNWKSPKTMSGSLHYYKDDGTIANVTIAKMSSTVYFPPVNSTVAGIMSALAPGSTFTVEPQQLADACTFKSQWRSSWAQSLITYHPEYYYYEWCITNSIDNYAINNYSVQYTPVAGTTYTGGVRTSDHYDSLLVEIEDLTLVTTNLTKLLDPLGLYGNSLADPYFDSNEPIAGKWYRNTKTANNATVPMSQLSHVPFIGNVHVPVIYTDAEQRFKNYLGSGLNLYEFSYAIVKGCATQYGTPMSTLIPACFSVYGTRPANGYDYNIMLPSTYVTAQESREIWEKYKFMYLSLKQKLQNEAAQSYATNLSINSSVLDSRNQCNDCIGDPNFTPLHVPFATWTHGFGLSSITTWLWNWFKIPLQSSLSGHLAPCGRFTAGLYTSKIKRFPSMADVLGQGTASSNASMYQATGKCPAANDLEVFIKDLGAHQTLTSTVSNLQTINGFTQGFYDFLYTTANSSPPSSYPALAWTPGVSGNVLTGNIGSLCNLTLNFPSNVNGHTWSNVGNFITNVYNMRFVSYSGGLSYFKVKIDVSTIAGAYTYELTGTICGNIGACSFPPVCTANSTAISIRNLLNQLANEDVICSNANVDITQPPFDFNFNSFVPALLPSGPAWEWDHPTGSSVATISHGSSSTSFIFQTASTADFANLCGSVDPTHMIDIQSIVPDGSGIAGQGILKYSITNDPTSGSPSVTTGTMAVTLSIDNGSTVTGINLGTCEDPPGMLCNTKEHKIKNDLETFLSTNSYATVLNSGSTVNITDNHNFSALLASHAAGSFNVHATTAAVTDADYYWIKGTSPTPTTQLVASICSSTTGSAPTPGAACCSITLTFSNTATTYNIQNVVSLSNMHVLTYPTLGGLQYSFTILATFADLHTELLLGNTTCFPIRECMDCDGEESEGEGGEGEGDCANIEDFEGSGVFSVYGTNSSLPCNGSFANVSPSNPGHPCDYSIASSGYGMNDWSSPGGTVYPYAGSKALYINFHNDTYGTDGAVLFEKTSVAVAPNTNYKLKAFIVNLIDHNNVFRLYINGTPVGDQFINSIAWTDYTFPTWNSGTATTATIKLVVINNTSPVHVATGAVAIDNVRLCDIPFEPCTTISTEAFTSFNSSSPGFTSSKTYDASCALNTNGFKVISSSIACPVLSPSSLNYDIYNHTPFVSSDYMFVQFKGDSKSDLYKKIYTVTPGRFYDFSAFLVSDTVKNGTLDGSITLTIDDGLSTPVAVTTPMSVLYSPWMWTSKHVSKQAATSSITVTIANSNYMGSNEALGIDDIVFTECVSPPCEDDMPNEPFPEVPYVNPCAQAAIDDAISEGIENYYNYIDSLKTDFVEQYIKKCMGGAVENFYLDYASRDYHYTLYYYDQAGNLVQTIPPQGVNILTSTSDLNASRAARAAGTQFATQHSMGTTYTYNSLNQLVKQYTPDAGESNFWYDALGRLVASQNAKQAAKFTSQHNFFSYTHYDALGRINEVGEVDMDHTFFGRTPLQLQGDLNASNYPNNLAVHSLNEVTRTYYGDDANYYTALAAVPSTHFTVNDSYSRGRVVATSIENTDDATDVTYNHATYYSYDVHGNVRDLLQHNPTLNIFPNQEFKLTQYKYDLVSGKVNDVNYQAGMPDQFFHKYEYDADNRITRVRTSSNNIIWNQDAKYFYYLHGPLARVEIGDDKIQGQDFAYTLQGWIKGVNSDKLSEDNDIGKDGNLSSATTNYNNTHKHVARDAYGYSLNYFTNAAMMDYKAIDPAITSTNQFASDASAIVIGLNTPVMYNGNIASMVTSYLNQDPLAMNVSTGLPVALNEPFPQANAYLYDQLNRIMRAKSSKVYSATTNSFTSGGDNKFRETFSYDANGNIMTVERFGNSVTMDNMSYHYYDQSGGVYTPNPAGVASPANATNRLAFVRDAISSGAYADDIDNQSAGNYGYDEIGNLKSDVSEDISNIEWTVYGKIKTIDKVSGPDLEFAYDASGNRIMKIVKPNFVSSRWRYTYYVRDAQGNVMATYEQGPDPLDIPEFKLSEQHIYGSSRLGVFENNIVLTNFIGAVNTTTVSRTLGLRSYELSNHLGNVIAVVTDKRNRVLNGGGTAISHYLPDIITTTDYYSFGSPMPGRKFAGANSYRYGMNGQEKDDEIFNGAYSAEYWEYDSRLGRRWNIDPIVKDWESPYAWDPLESTCRHASLSIL